MKKSMGVLAAMLFAVVSLTGARPIFAQTVTSFGSVLTSSFPHQIAFNPDHSQNIRASEIAMYTHDDYDRGRHDYDHKFDDKHWRKDKSDPAPTPAPEPSTILSFGAALLIGGGVLISRRMRKVQK